jgi:hypothetical protein
MCCVGLGWRVLRLLDTNFIYNTYLLSILIYLGFYFNSSIDILFKLKEVLKPTFKIHISIGGDKLKEILLFCNK